MHKCDTPLVNGGSIETEMNICCQHVFYCSLYANKTHRDEKVYVYEDNQRKKTYIYFVT